jgi:hypothetical protein
MAKGNKLGLLVLAGACGCAGARMAPPDDVSKNSEVLAVSDRSRASGALVDESFKLGSYAVANVDRKWDSKSGISVGPWGKDTKTTGYSFELKGGPGELKGKCESELKEQGILGLGGSFDWGSTTIACSCEGSSDKASLVLSKKENKLSAGGGDYALKPVHGVVGGGEQSAPSGFRADAEQPLGAVEVLYPGQVWLRKDLDDATKASASCLFAGLMLYKPPSDH